MLTKTPEKWAPLTGMPDGAETWGMSGYGEQEREWNEIVPRLKKDPAKDRFMEGWLRERVRGFAIETGQVEGLYTLRYGVTEQLIAEGFAGVVGAHTLEGLEDRTIQGLLEDQKPPTT